MAFDLEDGGEDELLMAEAATTLANGARTFASFYRPVAADLAEVDAILAREMSSRHAAVDEIVKHAVRLGGKRLRPALVLLVARACGRVTPEHKVAAAVAEMIHTATLVHDDVLDGASLRRHVATVNARYGEHTSVLLGDFLFTHAFYLASTLGTTFACSLFGQTTNQVCEGEMRQTVARGKLRMSETEYLEIIQAKTASLCACCCHLGAHFAGMSAEWCQRLSEFGQALGMAFQIGDDVLDLLGEEKQAGKSLGTDLNQLKLTLPVIRLRDTLPGGDLDTFFQQMQSPERTRYLRAALHQSDALAYTQQVAEGYIERAHEQLQGLPESDAKQVLLDICSAVACRQA